MLSSKRQKQKQQHRLHSRQHQRRHQKSSKGSSDGELLQPSIVRKEVKQLLVSAIDNVAYKLKQIPRLVPLQQSSSSPSSSVSEKSSPSSAMTSTRETFGETENSSSKKKKGKALSTSMESKDAAALSTRTSPSNQQEPFFHDLPSTETICIQTVTDGDDANGMILKFHIKLIKPDGTSKLLDMSMVMPNYEPSFICVGGKIAILE